MMDGAMQIRYEIVYEIVTEMVLSAMQIKYENVVSRKMHGAIQIDHKK